MRPALFASLCLAGSGCVSQSGEPARSSDRPAGSPAPASGSDSGETDPGSGGDSGSSADSADPAIDSGDSGDTGEPPPEPIGPRGLLIAQSWDESHLPSGAGAGQYGVIVLAESMVPFLADVRAANPDATILAYQKVGGMRSDGGDHASTGVQIHEADESWFLHDEAGERLWYCDYPEVVAADIGEPSYQAAWLTNVRDRLLRDGFDGVMMDDVNVFPGHCLGERGGTPVAEYATDAAYGEAVVDFMLAVGPGLIDAGLVVAPNIAMNPWEELHADQAQRMLPGATHWLREYWMRWDASENFTGDMWLSTLQTMRDAQAAGKGYLGLTYGPGVEGASSGQQFGRASWLMAWDGESDSHWGYLGADRAAEPFSEHWGPDLGRPLGEPEQQGEAWVRWFERGVAVVHPGDGEPVVVDLNGRFELDGGVVAQLPLASGEARTLRTAD